MSSNLYDKLELIEYIIKIIKKLECYTEDNTSKLKIEKNIRRGRKLFK